MCKFNIRKYAYIIYLGNIHIILYQRKTGMKERKEQRTIVRPAQPQALSHVFFIYTLSQKGCIITINLILLLSDR